MVYPEKINHILVDPFNQTINDIKVLNKYNLLKKKYEETRIEYKNAKKNFIQYQHNINFKKNLEKITVKMDDIYPFKTNGIEELDKSIKNYQRNMEIDDN